MIISQVTSQVSRFLNPAFQPASLPFFEVPNDFLNSESKLTWKKKQPKPFGCFRVPIYCYILPPKTNMEPENGGPLEKEFPFENHHFQVLC